MPYKKAAAIATTGSSSVTIAILAFIVIILVVLIFEMKKSNTIGVTKTHVTNVIKGGSRYDMAPIAGRDWVAPPDIRGAFIPPGAVPININTQGIPESYQQMGVINMGGQVLPLYGRRNGRGSDYYNYYTRTDTYNPVQVPVSFGRRDCTDDNGCKEVSDGDVVKVYGSGEGTVKLYNINAPKYIPGVV